MAPERVSLNGSFKRPEDEEAARERVMKQFETIGTQILNRTGSSNAHHQDPIANVLNDREKRALAAQLLGQAYVTAHNFIVANKDAIERIAEAVVEKREVYGDDLLELLDDANLVKPEIDVRDEAVWPKL
ncbi:MAG: hypothetical protein H0V20_06020 [Actinobacteria bacterium]|nr:hypothetical protein [Actinomycetota bacterium]